MLDYFNSYRKIIFSLIDTLFVIVFIYAYITMVYNSNNCILINSDYNKYDLNKTKINNSYSINITYEKIDGIYKEKIYFEKINKQNIRVIWIKENLKYLLYIILLFYSFLIIKLKIRKRKNINTSNDFN